MRMRGKKIGATLERTFTRLFAPTDIRDPDHQGWMSLQLSSLLEVSVFSWPSTFVPRQLLTARQAHGRPANSDDRADIRWAFLPNEADGTWSYG